jgi:hypothetical protein
MSKQGCTNPTVQNELRTLATQGVLGIRDDRKKFCLPMSGVTYFISS